jgi:uncharacterized protein DUF5681
MLNENNSRPSAIESGVEYKVGPGRPPKEYQFKPGQSGNPKGAKRKPKSMAPDLKAALEQALNKPIKLKQGEKERIVSMAVAGIEQLVAQYVKPSHGRGPPTTDFGLLVTQTADHRVATGQAKSDGIFGCRQVYSALGLPPVSEGPRRAFDLNGAAKTASTKHSSAIMVRRR